MTSAERLLFTAARNPRGVGFIPLGRAERTQAELEEDCRLAKVLWLELHHENGTISHAPVSDLGRLRGPATATHIIGFTAEQLVASAASFSAGEIPNLFDLLEADRLIADPTHQHRFLPPSELRQKVLAGERLDLAPVDYAHRCAEIQSSLDEAGASAPGHARSFLASAERYAAHLDEQAPKMEVYLATASASVLLPEQNSLRQAVRPPQVEDDPGIAVNGGQLDLL